MGKTGKRISRTCCEEINRGRKEMTDINPCINCAARNNELADLIEELENTEMDTAHDRVVLSHLRRKLINIRWGEKKLWTEETLSHLLDFSLGRL